MQNYCLKSLLLPRKVRKLSAPRAKLNLSPRISRRMMSRRREARCVNGSSCSLTLVLSGVRKKTPGEIPSFCGRKRSCDRVRVKAVRNGIVVVVVEGKGSTIFKRVRWLLRGGREGSAGAASAEGGGNTHGTRAI
eukprot:g55023.t1